jgi:hypothetical protein
MSLAKTSQRPPPHYSVVVKLNPLNLTLIFWLSQVRRVEYENFFRESLSNWSLHSNRNGNYNCTGSKSSVCGARARPWRSRSESYHGHSQAGNKHNNSAFGLRVNKIENAYINSRRSNFRDNQKRRIDRQEYRSFSYTSVPLRGGSSRRTRIIENPYADRLVTGITLTGVDSQQVHIKDVVAYPGRYLLSPLAYSLSQYERPRFINTQNYIDYISVAAKRKEYFTVTFHYD